MQRTEDRGQKTEDGRQKPTALILSFPSAAWECVPRSAASPLPVVPKRRLGMRPAKLCLANPPLTQTPESGGEAERAKQSFAQRIPKQSLGTTEEKRLLSSVH